MKAKRLIRPTSASNFRERNRNPRAAPQINVSIRKDKKDPEKEEYSKGLNVYEASLRSKLHQIENAMKEITHDQSIDSKDRTAVRNSTDLLQQELKEEIVLLQKESRKVRVSLQETSGKMGKQRSSMYFEERLRDFKIRHDSTVKRVEKIINRNPILSSFSSTKKNRRLSSAKNQPAYPYEEGNSASFGRDETDRIEADNRQPYPLSRPVSKYELYRRETERPLYREESRGLSSSRQDKVGSGIPSLSDFTSSPKRFRVEEPQMDFGELIENYPKERQDTFGRPLVAKYQGKEDISPNQPPLSSRRLIEVEGGDGIRGSSFQLLNQDIQHLRQKVLDLDSEMRGIRGLNLAKELDSIRTKEVKMQADINILRNEHSELILSYHKLERLCNSLKDENKSLREQLMRDQTHRENYTAQGTPRTTRPPRYLLSGSSNPPATHRTANPPVTVSVTGEGDTFRHQNMESAPPPYDRVNMSGEFNRGLQQSASKSNRYSTPGERRGLIPRSSHDISPIRSGRGAPGEHQDYSDPPLSDWVLERLKQQ